jgi:hypothetical protein
LPATDQKKPAKKDYNEGKKELKTPKSPVVSKPRQNPKTRKRSRRR